MNFFNRIRSLIVKELRSLFNDKSGRVLLFVPVVMQSILFPAAATLEVKNASIAVYNQDSGQASVELMQRFAASRAFTEFIRVGSQKEVEDVIGTREAIVAVRIPEDFSRKIAAGETAPVQVLMDGRRSVNELSEPAVVLSGTGAVHDAPRFTLRETKMSVSTPMLPPSESVDCQTAIQ